MTVKILLIMASVAVLTSGCNKSDKKKRPPAPPPKRENPSVARDVIDGVTGYTAVQHGKKAKETILKATEERDKDLKEFLDE